MLESCDWQIQPVVPPPSWLVAAVCPYLPDTLGQYAAQLLWQRGIRHPHQVDGFIRYQDYQPTSPFAFGEEMQQAMLRLQKAVQNQEKVAIWGDFDADGLTATAVLWDGLREFFSIDRQLTYFVPNRLTESHGLSISGIDSLAAQGYRLIITCDTGSTCLTELQYAEHCGIDVIVTDHHTLPKARPPVVAIINPRYLPSDHSLAHLSGVAVAYKLVEALYQTLPETPQRPLPDLLDLVAIGLIADLVNLTGECRYLAQIGIAQLQKNQDPIQPPRPGIAKLLELCRRSGDRPTDISFGLGPRINAISRIQGDARFCVELLTSQDRDRCHQLALETELANSRRRALQREVVQQVKAQLADLDLSTTRVIVLADAQWPIGILGLVAGQIAQEYNRPTILLCTDGTDAPDQPPLARGSARSIAPINLYDLLEQQTHLLHRFGGHPLAAGLSLPVKNIPLFTQAVNQQLRSQAPEPNLHPTIAIDLIVTVAELGKGLFQELKLLEPCGMGNPVPKLLIQNCWFSRSSHRKLKDLTGQKLEYLKTEFEIRDDSCSASFPGVWWGHYKDELPIGRCDAVVELDFNSYEDARRQKRYELRLIAVGKSAETLTVPNPEHWLIDRRNRPIETAEPTATQGLLMQKSPSSWTEFYAWCHRAQQTQQPLVLAYCEPALQTPSDLWQQVVGAAKYLSRTGKTVTPTQLQEKLNLGDRSLQIGLKALGQIGFAVKATKSELQIFCRADAFSQDQGFATVLGQFTQAVQEEQFMRQYFYQASLALLQMAADRNAGYAESN